MGGKIMSKKIVSVEEAVSFVKNGDIITCTGFINALFPEKLGTFLERRFLETGEPKGLTLLFSDGVGDTWGGKGLNHFAHEGMVSRLIGSHFGVCRRLGRLAEEGKVECYILPLGQITNLFRAVAARSPGLLSRIGLDTFVDPRHEGGRMNAVSRENLVDLVTIGGEEYLFYKSMPMDVAFLRGTTSDEDGNITMEREAVTIDTLAIAQAVKACGGKVIFQVERIAQRGTLKPHDVKVPGMLVDAVVIAEPEYHFQTLTQRYNPYYSGEVRAPADALPCLPLDHTKAMARRAALEIRPGDVINLGIGLAAKVANVLYEQGLSEQVTMTVESGVIGGVPQFGSDFGVAINPDAIVTQNDQFLHYNGGCLDFTCLGMAQVDALGNVNVSKFGGNIIGCGGFIDISQTAKTVVFLGTFTAKGLEVEVTSQGSLRIVREGQVRKFVDRVEQVTFSGKRACDNRQRVIYVTERAVFELQDNEVVLTEVAPGVDVEKDIIANMEFRPRVSPDVRIMDTQLFRP